MTDKQLPIARENFAEITKEDFYWVDKTLFDGLAISQNKDMCEKYMGKYPVVSISLKQVDGSTFESAYDQLRNVIQNEAFRLEILRDSTAFDDDERSSYNKIRAGEDDFIDIKNSIKIFCKLLEKHYGQKVIVLVDEYDAPLDNAYENGYYNQMMACIVYVFQIEKFNRFLKHKYWIGFV